MEDVCQERRMREDSRCVRGRLPYDMDITRVSRGTRLQLLPGVFVAWTRDVLSNVLLNLAVLQFELPSQFNHLAI